MLRRRFLHPKHPSCRPQVQTFSQHLQRQQYRLSWSLEPIEQAPCRFAEELPTYLAPSVSRGQALSWREEPELGNPLAVMLPLANQP